MKIPKGHPAAIATPNYARGAMAGDKGVSKRALEELELAAQWGASLPDVYTNLSFARLAESNAVGALATADVGVRLDEKHVPSLFNRAAALDALDALKQYGACIDTIDEILELSSGFLPAVQSKTSTLERMRKI